MKNLIWIFLVVLLSACGKDRVHDQAITELFEVSGFNNTLRNYQALVSETGLLILEQQKFTLDREKFKQATDRGCTFDILHKSATEDLKSNRAADVNYLKSIIGLYKSPLVGKLVALEGQASLPESKKAIQAYLLEAKNISVDPERQAVINRLIFTRRAEKNGVDARHAVARNIYAGVITPKPISRDEMEKISQQIRQELITQNNAVLPLQYQFIYREISNQDLQRYADFYQKEEIQKYIALTQVISEKILAVCATQAMSRVNSVSEPDLKKTS